MKKNRALGYAGWLGLSVVAVAALVVCVRQGQEDVVLELAVLVPVVVWATRWAYGRTGDAEATAATTGQDETTDGERVAQERTVPPELAATDEPALEDTPQEARLPVVADDTHAAEALSADDGQAERGDEELTQISDDGDKLAHGEAETFSLDTLARNLVLAADGREVLERFVREVDAREQSAVPPSSFERFLARLLREADLMGEDDEGRRTALDIIVTCHGGLFYVRMGNSQLPYRAYLRNLRIEAALNAAKLAWAYYDEPLRVGEEELYGFMQRATTSVCAQVPDVDMADWSYLAMPWQVPFGPSGHGEWAVRQALSEAIESAQVPHRLEARFRTNVAAGDVALELRATPASVFPRSAYVGELGVVSTSLAMRRAAASRYAVRMGLLMANHAFRASERVRRVWVASVLETPTSHSCLFSVCIERRAMARVRMASVREPFATLRMLGGRFEEEGGVLIPAEPCFYLEDERFCPPRRYDLWNLSDRSLPAAAALSLGSSRVSDLLIHEELPRTVAAEEMLRGIVGSKDPAATQKSVRAILGAASRSSNVSVLSASERLADKIVSGAISLDEPERIRDEMVSGEDVLARALGRVRAYAMEGDLAKATHCLRRELATVDREARYEDTPAVAYRSYASFAERALYNRREARDKRSVVLVPDSYLMAHIMLASMLVASSKASDHAEAIRHARRAAALAPMTAAARLCLVACLEQTGDLDGAAQELCDMLELSFDAQSIAVGYYRMAGVQWKLGNVRACQACYQQCVRLMPMMFSVVMAECQMLVAQGAAFEDVMSEGEVRDALSAQHIPEAPTDRTAFLLYDCATASVDAEVFPVARDLMQAIEALTGDDVMRGIRNSLEREPDR